VTVSVVRLIFRAAVIVRRVLVTAIIVRRVLVTAIIARRVLVTAIIARRVLVTAIIVRRVLVTAIIVRRVLRPVVRGVIVLINRLRGGLAAARGERGQQRDPGEGDHAVQELLHRPVSSAAER
jgi:hypothetical protein